MFDLRISGPDGLILMIGSDDLVQIPLLPSERTMCRQALLDALTLLDQTEIKRSISSMADLPDLCSRQTAPALWSKLTK